MKTIFSLALSLVCVSSFGQSQGVSVRSLSGLATNLTVVSNNVIVYHGTVATPYRTLDLAKAAMVTGDRAYITPGFYDCSNHLVFPRNCAVFGAGAGVTIIRNWFTNGTPAPLIAGSDNLYLATLQITNMWGDPDGANAGAGVPSSCFGMHQNIDSAYTNAVLDSVLFYGGSDTIYNRKDSGEVSYKVVNSELHGPWDICTAFGTAKHRYKFYNTRFDHRPTASHNNFYDILVSSFTADSLWELTGCTLYMSNGIAGKSSYYYGAEDSTSQGARFINCVFTNAVPGALSTEFNITPNNPLSFAGCLGITMAQIGDGDPDPQIDFGQLIGNSLNFGGDAGTTAHVLTNTVGGVSLNGNINASGYTNSGLLTGIVGTDSNGKQVKATLSGAAWNGTTFTVTGGGFTTPFDTTQFGSANSVTSIVSGVKMTNVQAYFTAGHPSVYVEGGIVVTNLTTGSSIESTNAGINMTNGAGAGRSAQYNSTFMSVTNGANGYGLTFAANVFQLWNFSTLFTNSTAANSPTMAWNQNILTISNAAAAQLTTIISNSGAIYLTNGPGNYTKIQGGAVTTSGDAIIGQSTSGTGVKMTAGGNLAGNRGGGNTTIIEAQLDGAASARLRSAGSSTDPSGLILYDSAGANAAQLSWGGVARMFSASSMSFTNIGWFTNGYVSFATNYFPTVNTAGYTNSGTLPGFGGTNSMQARVTATSGTVEFYTRSGAGGQTICGQGVWTNTLGAAALVPFHVGVNQGFVIRSPVGVDIQVYAE